MNRNRQTKSPAISNSRWLAYAAAGAATALGNAPSADAEIHYSGPVNVTMRNVRQTALPLTGGASLVFDITARPSSGYPRAYFGITGAEAASAQVHPEIIKHILENLRQGRRVSQGEFSSVGFTLYVGAIQTYSGEGYFPDYRNNGYIGFKFDIGNGTQYGWARIQTDHSPRYHYIIKDYAWADVGDSINAGQRTSTDGDLSAIPPKGSLGLLALGGAGLEAWRRSRAETNGSGR
jgi:hypothetical protein